MENDTPTLEEIILRYKNAYSVIGVLSTNNRHSILLGGFYIYNESYFAKCKPWDVMIWSKIRGYAKISETKAERFLRISKRINE